MLAAYLAELSNSAVFAIEPFDLKAAIEAAESQRRALDTGNRTRWWRVGTRSPAAA